jgi:putative ABC transport system permease protein
MWFVLGIAIVVGLFSGIYPAIYLSSFNASRALKGIQLKGQHKSPLRNSLLVFQFLISFCIIIFTFTVNRQISYLRNKDLGFDKENLLVINNISQLKSRNVFKEEVNKNAAIISSTLSSHIPSGSGHGELFRKMQGEQEDFIMSLIDADADFIATFGLNIDSGIGFSSKDLSSSSPKVVINQKAQKILNYNNAIGETIMGLDDGRILEISGIINDFDYYLAQVELRPIVIRPYLDANPENEIHFLTAKIASSDLQQTIGDLEKIWNKQKTGIPFQYHFYNQIFNNMYLKEIHLGNLLTLFSSLAISIALLGLVGLISFHTEQLTKSIGIRKVFGATSFNILSLITRDFLKLFIIAFVVAVPIANYAVEDWLDTFVFKMDIGVLLFVIPGFVVISISLLTIWAQSYKAANTNPIDAIRTE